MIPLSFHQSRPEYSARIAATAIFTKLRKVGTPEVPLSELIESTQYGYTASATETPVGPHFVRITDLKEGAICWPTVPFCECGDVATYRIEEGDLLFARTGATTGKTHLVSEPPPVESVFASYLIRVRPKPTTSAAYLNAFFQSDVYWQQLVDYKSGSAQANVNATKLATLQVPVVGEETQKAIARFMKAVQERSLNPSFPLPPLPSPLSEQQKIVEWIDAVATRVEEAKGLVEETTNEIDDLARSILWASEANSTPTLMSDLVEQRTPDVEVTPHDIYDFAGVYCFGRGVFQGQTKSGMDFKYPKLTRLKARNFTYPKLMAWEGAFGVVPDECDGLVVSTEFPVFEINEGKVLPDVLDVYFKTPSIWPKIAGASTGTNVRRRRLNPKDFLKYEFPLPPRKEQEKIAEIRSRTEGPLAQRQETIDELNGLMKSVLNQVFNAGEATT